MHKCTFYECYQCKKPYFGGLVDCQQDLNNENVGAESLLCQDCLLKEVGAGQTSCDKHGSKHIVWKCMFCCSQARYFCFGSHYFCKPCHDDWNRRVRAVPRMRRPPLKYPCRGSAEKCPLGIAHPPPSKDPREGGIFPLGCELCRSEKEQLLSKSFQQVVVTSRKLPTAFIYDANRKLRLRNDLDDVKDLPDFIVSADEIEEALL